MRSVFANVSGINSGEWCSASHPVYTIGFCLKVCPTGGNEKADTLIKQVDLRQITIEVIRDECESIAEETILIMIL
jgi:hypothetical protein